MWLASSTCPSTVKSFLIRGHANPRAPPRWRFVEPAESLARRQAGLAMARTCSRVTSMLCASRPWRCTAGTSLDSSPRASKPQSQRTISSTFGACLLDRIQATLSPLVPGWVRPDLHLGLALEHAAEELDDLRAAGKRLRLLGRLPGVDAEEVPLVLRVQVNDVRDVARLAGHVLGCGGDLVVDLLDRMRIGLEPGPGRDGDCHSGCLLRARLSRH